jgi:hypothetical protein
VKNYLNAYLKELRKIMKNLSLITGLRAEIADWDIPNAKHACIEPRVSVMLAL